MGDVWRGADALATAFNVTAEMANNLNSIITGMWQQDSNFLIDVSEIAYLTACLERDDVVIPWRACIEVRSCTLTHFRHDVCQAA